jgi:hypothetical protein
MLGVFVFLSRWSIGLAERVLIQSLLMRALASVRDVTCGLFGFR